MEFYSKTDIGKKRYSNQDAVNGNIISKNLAWTVVCDGMGGASGGDIASTIAVEKISETISKVSENISEENLINTMKESIQVANTFVFNKSMKNELLRGMGTTVVLAVVKDMNLYVMHAGDSRAYLISDEGIFQISVDHSIVQEMINSGEITQKEAKNHMQKNIITRALGINEVIKFDFSKIPLKYGDVILVCTDGLSNHLEDSEIYHIFKNKNFNEVAKSLIDKCNSRGGKDNITVSLIKC